jgi:hypothetical protein
MGYDVDRPRLEAAARILACPIKVRPPHWQHGRVLYAALRRYLEMTTTDVQVLDVGTAKGFSALCLQWAICDSGRSGFVVSVDVIDPDARVMRNTVAELSGPLTVRDTLEPWPDARAIQFLRSTGVDWLLSSCDRVHVASIDGKHTEDVVSAELLALSARQEPGDLVFVDDLQVAGVASALNTMAGQYFVFERFDVLPWRAYAVAVRR